MTNSDRCKFLGTVYAYSAYGQAITLGPDGGNPLQYTGRENDGTGLIYYRARYYDPILKQFVSEDPIGMLGGANFYAYVGGNPMSFSDPMGNNPAVIAGAVIGAIAGVGGALASGGGLQQALVGGLYGAASGAAIGFLAPVIFGQGALTGVAAAVGIRTASGVAGNLLGQLNTYLSDPTCFSFNVVSTIGSGIAGAFAGVWSAIGYYGNASGLFNLSSVGSRLAFGAPQAIAPIAASASSAQSAPKSTCTCP